MEKKLNLRAVLQKNNADLDEKQIAFIDSIDGAITEALSIEGTRTADAMKEALRNTVGEVPENETIVSQIRSIAEALDKVEKKTISKLGKMEKYQLRKKIEDNKDKILNAVRTGQEFEMAFDAVRVAAAHLNTNTVDVNGINYPAVENFEVDTEVARIRYPENFILNIIRNSTVALVPEQRIKTEQSPVDGAVTIVAEGGTKPLLQYTFVRTSTERQKYAGRIEWSEEFEMDNSLLFDEIVRMFELDVIRAWNNGLLEQIIDNAVAYTTSVLDGTLVNPDNVAVAVAASSVINAMNFNANTVIMHPSDVVATMFQQDLDGNYRMIPFVQNGQINGMSLTATNGIDQGKALIGDSTVYQEKHSAFILRFGTYNDQFISNEKTAIGEVFSLLSIAEIDLPAWMYVDLETVKASLLKEEA